MKVMNRILMGIIAALCAASAMVAGGIEAGIIFLAFVLGQMDDGK